MALFGGKSFQVTGIASAKALRQEPTLLTRQSGSR